MLLKKFEHGLYNQLARSSGGCWFDFVHESCINSLDLVAVFITNPICMSSIFELLLFHCCSMRHRILIILQYHLHV
jgi:hypothetical protein